MLVFTGRPCRCPCAAPVLPLCRPTPTSRLYPSLCCWGLCLRSPSSFSLGCWGPCLRDSASSSLCCWGLGLCVAAASSLCCWGPCLRVPAPSSFFWVSRSTGVPVSAKKKPVGLNRLPHTPSPPKINVEGKRWSTSVQGVRIKSLSMLTQGLMLYPNIEIGGRGGGSPYDAIWADRLFFCTYRNPGRPRNPKKLKGQGHEGTAPSNKDWKRQGHEGPAPSNKDWKSPGPCPLLPGPGPSWDGLPPPTGPKGPMWKPLGQKSAACRQPPGP